jgi:hypothetical protein
MRVLIRLSNPALHKDCDMAWQRLHNWLAGRRSFSVDATMSLTLLTLVAKPNVEADELAFYADAEFEMLVEWARMGRFILALNAADRNELTLLCVDDVYAMAAEVERLPLIAAGLAQYDIRTVIPLKFLNISQSGLH